MDAEFVRYAVDEGIAAITIDRPQAANAQNPQMLKEPIRPGRRRTKIRNGTPSVNGGNWYAADSPFGGYKSSDIGRQGGLEGLLQYVETKTIALPVR